MTGARPTEPGRLRRATFAGGVLLALVILAGAGLAQVRSRTLGVHWRRTLPSLTFSARDLANPQARRKLESGLPQTIVTRMYAYADAGRTPVAVETFACRVVFDLYESEYRVQISTSSGDRTITRTGIEDVLDACLVYRDYRIGRDADWRGRSGRPVYFAVLVEMNPMSPETVRRIRRWLSSPPGARADGDSFYGSFVSIFVDRDIRQAERTVQFRSQEVRVP